MRKRKFTVTAAMFALSAILLSEIQMQPAYAVEGWTNEGFVFLSIFKWKDGKRQFH